MACGGSICADVRCDCPGLFLRRERVADDVDGGVLARLYDGAGVCCGEGEVLAVRGRGDEMVLLRLSLSLCWPFGRRSSWSVVRRYESSSGARCSLLGAMYEATPQSSPASASERLWMRSEYS